MAKFTGYGAHKNLFFNGENYNYELIVGINCSRHKQCIEGSGTTLAVATAEVLDNLVQLLDDKSLSFIIQQDVDKMSLEKFKHSLKNFDDNERARTNYHSSESVMHFKARAAVRFELRASGTRWRPACRATS